MNDLNYVEWFAQCSILLQRWIICTLFSDLYYIEWFLEICATLNGSYSFKRLVLRWMIRSVMDDLYKVESFGLGRLLNIGFLMSARCHCLRKYCNIFYTNLIFWYFPDLKISRKNRFGPVLVIKTFLITLVETIINVFSRHI